MNQVPWPSAGTCSPDGSATVFTSGRCVNQCDGLAARADRAACGAKFTTVLFYHRGIAAFFAKTAGHGPEFERGGAAVVVRHFEHAHVSDGEPALVEYAEHREPVNDQPRNVGDGARIVFLPFFAGHPRHEIAERFIVSQ